VCGEVTVTDPTHPLYGQTLPQLPVALRPDHLTLALAALAQLEQEEQAESKQWELRLERARDLAKRAERQYQAVEPENRLVARELPKQWEEQLRAVETAEKEYHAQKTCPQPLAGWMRSVPLATQAASVGKSCGHGRSLVRPTVESRLGSFGNRGNGQYRMELRKALAAITRYLTAHQFPQARALLRLDGQYGTGAVLADLAGFAFVTRGKEYSMLAHPLIQARLHLPPDQFQQRPESQMVRSLYDCPELPVGPEGTLCRVVVATHPAGKKKSPVGVTRAGVVYELFGTLLPQHAFTACDVVELYLHRGAFEPILSDEDIEQNPDRWCSHSAS
jgi:hypothetical protein